MRTENTPCTSTSLLRRERPSCAASRQGTERGTGTLRKLRVPCASRVSGDLGFSGAIEKLSLALLAERQDYQAKIQNADRQHAPLRAVKELAACVAALNVCLRYLRQAREGIQ